MTIAMQAPAMPKLLVRHLRSWAGAVPSRNGVMVIANPRVAEPGWDGRPELLTGLIDPYGNCVVSLPPGPAYAAKSRMAGVALLDSLPALLGLTDRTVETRTFRWTDRPAEHPIVGQWLSADSPDAPHWLRPFGGQVLVASDEHGRHLAGVGIKRHDAMVNELSVVTQPQARGRGLARALVAQAAAATLRTGAIPTYLHLPENEASAHVADAAGFFDYGWKSLALDGS